MNSNLKFFLSFTLIFTIVNLSFLNTALGQRGKGRGDWDMIGSRMITKGADHDVIEMNKRDGLFTKLKFHVMKSPVHIDNLKIVFQNGDTENIIIDRNFAKGEWSSVIDLVGNKRFIDKIIFNYHTKLLAVGQGEIKVFGKN